VAKIRFGEHTINLPRNRALRIALGVTLVLLGALGGWLPILGFWMAPLGLIILSVDIAIVRRWRRRATVAIVNWWRKRTWLRAMWARVMAWWQAWRGRKAPAVERRPPPATLVVKDRTETIIVKDRSD
jgi:hypothetical protein